MYLHTGYPVAALIGPFNSLEEIETFKKENGIGNFCAHAKLTDPKTFALQLKVERAKKAWQSAVSDGKTDKGFAEWLCEKAE